MSLLSEILIRGGLLAGVAILISRCASVQRVAGRSTVLAIALCWLVFLPLLVAAGARLPVTILPAAQYQPEGRVRAGLFELAARASVRSTEAAAPANDLTPVPPTGERQGIPLLLGFYAVGIVLTILSRIWAEIGILRLVGRATVAESMLLATAVNGAAAWLGVRRLPRALLSHQASVPFVYGLWRPVVVFPDDAESWDAGKVRAVALHEMAHVRRHDLLIRAIADLACAFNWFNPLAWAAKNQLHAVSEIACDDAVVLAGVAADAYAEELVRLARRRRGPIPGAALGVGSAAELKRRIEEILSEARPTVRQAPVGPVSVTSCLAALVLAVGQPVAAQAGDAARTLNVSNGGPEISSNGAGLQARWVERGRHSAMFVTGNVDLRDALSGNISGNGNLLVLQEGADGLEVFEWRSMAPSPSLSPSLRRTLGVGAMQLARLAGREPNGYPGSTLSGLPAVSDDPAATLIQAGWLSDGYRFGVVVRGHWRLSGPAVTALDPHAWVVVYAVNPRDGSTRRLQITRDPDGTLTSALFVNGSERAADADALSWGAEALRALQRMAPDFAGS